MNILSNTSNITCDIVEYIAGYVVSKLKTEIVCCECVELLVGNVSCSQSLVKCKNRGGLVQPSKAVEKLCLIAESVVKFNLNKGDITSIKNLTEKMTSSVMKKCIGMDLFPGDHFLDNGPEQSHYVILIKAIAKKYFKLRLHHFSKKFNESIHKTKLRNYLLKTVTFMGQ
ncbi:uncharacterized protein LOC124374538 [Homalodisca vitripennis]|uniref:uncharacterized protein LOC124374538 n=1 Tax=Homalodisca vitripennis TaxID=197043 RepID=UPI001EECAD11|nr:uncharacterized protein LOC124374538 [Homalodisca vitripennis]